MGLEDVLVEVLRLLGTPVDGRRLMVAARGHRVELDVARVSIRPPSVRPLPAPARPRPRNWLPSWPAWGDPVPDWAEWTEWTDWSRWGEAAPGPWPAFGRIELALRDVAVDGRTPFEVLDVGAAEVAVELA